MLTSLEEYEDRYNDVPRSERRRELKMRIKTTQYDRSKETRLRDASRYFEKLKKQESRNATA